MQVTRPVDELVGFWIKVFERFTLPSAALEPRNVVLCRFSPDGGRVDTQPANRPYTQHIGRESVEMTCALVKTVGYGLPEDAAALLAPVARPARQAVAQNGRRPICRVTFDGMKAAESRELPPA